MRGPTLYGSGVPLPEKRSRSISNVSLRILALLFCCEQLILNMRRTSRASLWGSNPTESTTMSTGMRRTKSASVSSARIMTFLPPMDGWMDGWASPSPRLHVREQNEHNPFQFHRCPPLLPFSPLVHSRAQPRKKPTDVSLPTQTPPPLRLPSCTKSGIHPSAANSAALLRPRAR